MMKTFSLYHCFFYFVSGYIYSFPIQNIFLKQIASEQGLSQNSVYAVQQDHQGLIWFGTKDGLNRYDGYRFTVFRNRQNDHSSLSDNFVTRVFEDRRGRLWVGMQTGGLQLFDRAMERFLPIPLSSQFGADEMIGAINTITEDSSGSLWIGVNGGGLIRINTDEKNNFTIQRFQKEISNPLSNIKNRITAIFYDNNGELWIGNEGHLYSVNVHDQKFLFQRHSIAGDEQKNLFDILCFFRDSQDKFWFGSEHGLHLYDTTMKKFIQIPLIDKKGKPLKLNVRVISEDHQGLLWLGTFDNIYTFDRTTGTCVSLAHLSNLKENVGIVSIGKDRNGSMWLGSNGEGIFVYHPNATRFQTYTHRTIQNPRWQNRSVRSLYEDPSGKLWIGSYGGLFVSDRERIHFKHLSHIAGTPVRKIIQSRNKTLWLASGDGIINLDMNGSILNHFRHNPNDSTSIRFQSTSSIFEDSKGNIWALTEGVLSLLQQNNTHWKHYEFFPPLKNPNDPIPAAMLESPNGLWFTSEVGLWHFNTTTKTFSNYRKEHNNNGLNYNVILSLCYDPEEPEKYLWVGTAGGGLNKFDQSTGTVTTITVTDGLPNNVIYAIIPDTSGNLWLSTNKGIATFNPKTRVVSTYFYTDGLQGNEYNSGAYFKNTSGEIFFGGINGFDIFHPSKIHANTYMPDVVFTEFQLFNRTVEIGDKTNILTQSISQTETITLNYTQNNFSLSFASLDYTVPEKNCYRYWMEGFTDEFIELGTNRTVSFTNLDPGTYTFHVQGSNSDGIWNRQNASLNIHILPPFWMTWWFRSIGIASLLSLLVFFYRRRIASIDEERLQKEIFTRKLIENQENERKRIAAEMHDSLGQNLLVMKNRALLGLQDQSLPKHLRQHFQEISETASATLKEVRQISHNLRPYELDRFGLTDAIHSMIEKVQNSSTTKFTSQIGNIDNLFNKELEINLYRIIQECLNNIIKHSKATESVISITKNEEEARIIIRDNGKGFDNDPFHQENRKTHGLGLRSLDERIRMMGGKCEIQTSVGQGTTITMSIPLQTDNK